MKAYKDMSVEEKLEFRRLGAKVAKELRRMNADLTFEEKSLLICMIIKTVDRSMVNLKTEYDIDKKLFVDGAIEMAEQFTKNLMDFLIAGRSTGSPIPQKIIDQSIAIATKQRIIFSDPVSREAIDELFVSFFSIAKEDMQ